MSGLLDGLRALGPARLGAMAAVAAGMLAVLAVLAMRGGSAQYALLYADLDLREGGQIAEQLDRQHIPYQIGADGSRILVPAADVARARMLLARDGLPSGGSIGNEIFDRGDGLAASSFQQSINQTRALEGELSRTIRGITGVRAARVHLVLPKREPFARDRQDAQASVMLTMSGAGRLDREGAQAIVTLVSAAVPGLRPHSITVIDSRGDVLARAGEPAGAVSATANAQELRRSAEQRLSRAVEEMLERGFGVGHVRAEAAIDLDFDHVQETREQFDPEGQVPRSTQTTTENNKSTEATPTVSVQNNLPNADAASPGGTGSTDQKSEETTNFEIGKTVRTLVRDQASTRKISVAVMIDGAAEAVAAGVPGTMAAPAVRRALTTEEIARVTGLVRGAIGYDEKRGDHVEVVSMAFADTDAGNVAPPAGLLGGLKLEKADLLRLAETGLLGLFAVLALLLVVRPMVARLTMIAPALGDASALAMAGLPGPGGLPALAGPVAAYARTGVPALSGPAVDAPLMIEDDRLVSVAQVEGQVRASSLRRTAELAARHPEESLAILRGWLAQDAA